MQDVAAACGIPDVHYFTRLFRRITGMTPREWETLKDRAWNVAGMDFANILYLPVPDCQPAAGIRNAKWVFLIYTAFGISDDPCFSKL